MKNYRKGFTLMEVVITLALISIMLVAVLSIYNTSIINIFKSGDRTDRLYEVKDEVDGEIIEKEANGNGYDRVTVSIPGLETIIIRGTLIENKMYEDLNIITFVPNK